MTPAFTARKRAEEFHQVVEHASTGGAASRYADLAPVLATLAHERELAVVPRADYARDLRSRLVAAAVVALAPDTAEQAAARTATPRTRGRERKMAAALSGFAIVAAGTSMAVAAQTALPGETLYPLKRAIEDAHAHVQSGDDKGTTLLASASGRLQEVEALSGDGQDAATVSATLADFAAEATEATNVLLADYRDTGSADSLQALRDFTAHSLATLSRLEALVPDGSRGSLIAARQLLSRIDQQALAACPGCGAAVPSLLQAPLPQIVQPVATRHETASTHQGAQEHGTTRTEQQPPSSSSSSSEDPGTTSSSDPQSGGEVLTAGDDQGTSSSQPQQGGSEDDPLGTLTEPLHTGAGASSSDNGVADLLTGIVGALPGPQHP